jgi:hypothetical protein
MTTPAIGTTFDGAGFNDVDSRFLERGKLRQVLMRDARGKATDISPHNDDGTVKWTPFAVDGTWRGDLCAFRRIDGKWAVNPDDTQGFHIAGAFKEGDGPSTKPNIREDDFMILQSNFPFDSDIVEEGEPFSFTAVETAKPLIRRLRNNLPLNAPDGTVLVELPGLANAGWSRPLDADNVERQCLLVSEFKKGGLPIYTVDGYSLAKVTGIGASKKDKRDSEAAELTYMPLPDGYFMAMVDGVYRPILRHTWVGGAGWAALSGLTSPEQWTVTLGTQASGTFVLSWGGNTTTAIPYNSTAATVKAALVALDDGYTAGDWAVAGNAGGPYTVTPPEPTLLTGSGASLATPGNFTINPVTS